MSHFLSKEHRTQLKNAKEVIKRVVLSLQERAFKDEVGIEVTEVFKGGSMGQETTVPGHHDIDLVLYSRSLDVATVVKNDGYGDLVKKINAYLSRELRGLCYRHEKYTNVAVTFECTMASGGTIDVDLLLSPYWPTHTDLLQSLRPINPPLKRMLFSASTSKWQTDFIIAQRQRVRVLIGRAKAWRNMEWKDGMGGRPKSYMMSLLVITALKTLPDELQTRKGMCTTAAIETAEKMKELIAEIKEKGKRGDLDLRVPGGDVPAGYADLLPPRLRIVDPANPANNLYLSGVGPVDRGIGKWDIFADKIRSFDISKPAEKIMESYGQY